MPVVPYLAWLTGKKYPPSSRSRIHMQVLQTGCLHARQPGFVWHIPAWINISRRQDCHHRNRCVRTTWIECEKSDAIDFFHLQGDKPVLLILEAVWVHAPLMTVYSLESVKLKVKDIQVIWQTGRYYYDRIKEVLEP